MAEQGHTQQALGEQPPTALPFPLEDGETVVLFTRRHWSTFWPGFVAVLLVASVPLGFALGLLAKDGGHHAVAWRLAAALAVLWLGFWLARAALLKYRYDRDIWVITNRRVVDAIAPAPFHFSMSTAALEQIQDISTRVDGLLATLLRYGDVACQTAGETGHVSFRQIPRPQAVAMVLQQECLRVRNRERDRAQ